MAAITDPGSVMAAITYPPGSVIDGIGYRLTAPLSRVGWCISLVYTIIYIINKMKKEVGMLLQKRADTGAVGIYKLYEENTH